MTLRALSFDFDGSLSDSPYQDSEVKDIVRCNQSFLDLIKKENEQFSQTIVFNGSLRQSKVHDDRLSRRNDTGSCFLALVQIATYLKATLYPILLADIFGDLPEGVSYYRILNMPETQLHATNLHDSTKLTLIYSQVHCLANNHPFEPIIFDFFDDRIDILYDLSNFFNNYKQLLPKNVCLRLNQYEHNIRLFYGAIQGQGEQIDTTYRQTIINMIEMTPREENDNGRRCTDYVTPTKLNTCALSIINEPQNNWTTKKSASLKQSIHAKLAAGISEPPFTPELHLLKTLVHLKNHIPKKDIKYEYITHAMLNRLHCFYETNQPISIEMMEMLQEVATERDSLLSDESESATFNYSEYGMNFFRPIIPIISNCSSHDLTHEI